LIYKRNLKNGLNLVIFQQMIY